MAVQEAHWIIYAIDDSGAAHYAYSIEGDTLIGGIYYKKMYLQLLKNDVVDFEEFEPPYQIKAETLIGVIRDDLPNKKVYYQSFTNPLSGYDTCDVYKDVLLYDFSVEVGDTITGCLQYDHNTPNVIDTIYSEFLFGKDRTSYFGNHASTALTEAIGTGLGPFWAVYAFPHPAKPTVLVDYCVGKPEVCGLLLTPATEIRNDWNIKLYPNPAAEQLNVELPGIIEFPLDFQVHNLTGNLIYTKTLLQKTRKGIISLETLPDGLFTLTLRNSNGISSIRFVKN